MAYRRLLALVALALFALSGATSSVASTPPPGATALCRDGSYSFSQHHSGTCSHHGGVARWLDATATATTASFGGAPDPAVVGKTVLFAKRTQTANCTRGTTPDRQCSPGAYYSKLTKTVICASTFRTSTIRYVPDSEKHQVETEYGMAAKSYGRTIEIDHIVSLELGGSNDIANLFPEPGAGAASYHDKDKLENKLHDLVCAGTMTLAAARKGIASNWKTLYHHVYGTNP